jgi:hypothetical protein
LHDFTFSFFRYSGLPYVAVVQNRNPAATIPAGITSFQVRIVFSFRFKAYPDVPIF